MSKATLEFNLPEEQQDFYRASKGNEAFCALEDIRQPIRDWLKHGHDFKTADEALEAVFALYHEAVEGLEVL